MNPLLIIVEDYFLKAKRWDPLWMFELLRTFELQQLVCLVEWRNKCAKVVMEKIIGRPLVGYFHDIPVVEGWYRVWVVEMYHPQTPP